MSGNAFEGDYDLTDDELASLGELDGSDPEEVVEPKESEADVKDQPEADDKPEDAEDKSEDKVEEPATEPEAKSTKTPWREVLGRDDIDYEGFLQAKLDELPPEVAQQRQYLSRLATEYQQKLQELEAKATQAAEPQPPSPEVPGEEPPAPSFEDDQATFTAKQRALREWDKQEAVRAAKADSPELVERLKAMEQRFEQQEHERSTAVVNSRLEYIAGLPGFTPEIGKQLNNMADRYPQMGAMMMENDGADYVFRMAKMAVDDRLSTAQKVTHETTAPDRVVPRATPKVSATAKDEITGDTPEEWVTSLADRPEFDGLFDN